MARCPYGSHRLLLAEDFRCKRCGEDFRLYAALRDLPVTFYNEARRLWDAAELEEAATWLYAALKLRGDFAEAHWLLGVIEAQRNAPNRARYHLGRAQELGAAADPDWLPAHPTAKVDGSVSPGGEEAGLLIEAVARFCQAVQACCLNATITSSKQSNTRRQVALAVTVAGEQDRQMLSEAMKQSVLQIEETYGVVILFTIQTLATITHLADLQADCRPESVAAEAQGPNEVVQKA